MTQPLCRADMHKREVLEGGPDGGVPVGTVTFPPAMIAATSNFLSAGLVSTWAWSNLISMIEPWEWPMTMMGLPLS